MRFTFVILLFCCLGADAQMIIKAHANYIPLTGCPGGSLLLDQYCNSSAAYSIRKLRTAYTGNAIRVRRSNDNTEQDIGFTAGGDLDTASMKTFVGANSGFVTTWYDQSGNARNATQTTAANQPRIVNAGTVERQGGEVNIKFDGTNDHLINNNLASVFTGSDKYLRAFTVASLVTVVGSTRIAWGFGNTANNNEIRYLGSSFATGFTDPVLYQDRDSTGTPNTAITVLSNFNTQRLISSFSNGRNSRIIYNNNIEAENTTTVINPIRLNTFTIGALVRTTTSLYTDLSIQELVIYDFQGAGTRIAIQNNINSYYGIY